MRTTVSLLALAFAVAAPQLAHAGNTKTILRDGIVGYAASASWDYQVGNVATFVSVVVSNDTLHQTASGPVVRPLLSVAISQYDITSSALIRNLVADSETFEFTIDHGLGTAHLQVSNLAFYDLFNTTGFTGSVDLTWTGSGDVTVLKSTDHFSSPGFKYNSRFKGEFREAQAIGSIFGDSTQFTPVPSTSGMLQHNNFGEVSIQVSAP